MLNNANNADTKCWQVLAYLAQQKRRKVKPRCAKMNRRDLTRFEDIDNILDKRKQKEDFSLYVDDLSEELQYK